MLGSLLLALALSPAALADEPPTVQLSGDGTVEARLRLPAEAGAEVRKVLADPAALGQLTSEVLSVETVERGSCQEVTRRTRGMFRPFKLRALRCPTAEGWEESLLEGSDFKAYATEWRVVETADGTEVIYRVRTELDVAVPQAVINQNVVQSTRNQLIKLARRVLGK